MIKNKITNISNVLLDLFIKSENLEDVLVTLKPGDVCFSQGEELSKSVIIFNRKNLISIDLIEFEQTNVLKPTDIKNDLEEEKSIFTRPLEVHKIELEEKLINPINIETFFEDENPYKDLLDSIEILTNSPLEEAQKQAEIYTNEPIKEKKKYTYKKKRKPGPKKKPGPKPGSKRKKK